MQLHWGWAVIGALLIGAALVWWTQPGNGSFWKSGDAHSDATVRDGRSGRDAGPTLYRWVDAKGVVNITTDHPPAGRRFSIVHINPDQNIVPMTVEGPASSSR